MASSLVVKMRIPLIRFPSRIRICATTPPTASSPDSVKAAEVKASPSSEIEKGSSRPLHSGKNSMAALAIHAHGHGLLQHQVSWLRLSSSSSSLPLHTNLYFAYSPSLRKYPAVPSALFWGQKRQSSKRVTLRPQRENLVISADHLSQQAKQETTRDSDASPLTLTVSVVSSISLVSAEAWDLCALEAAGSESVNPFVAHAFLSSLEDSKSAVAEEGWLPQHLVARDAENEILGVVPLYLKSHSYGEYVFDHAWANAFFRYGGKYYPKLQCCVPFTPATGPRILVRAGSFRDQVFDGLVKCMQQLTNQMKASSLHITFPEKQEWERVAKMGYLQRMGVQYHWKNRNYINFDEFLMDLKQSKRKNIRQERKKVVTQNITMKRLRGDDIKPRHWDAFYTFYRNTTDNKWGQAYLTREFFHLLGERMGDRVLLVTAEDKEELVAGALNLIGGDTLYGRNWGCKEYAHYHALHFEACYYQAIEAAIEWKLKTVEAGAQGEHKIQRGYLPTATYSAHYIPDPDFHNAIASFLSHENVNTQMALQYLQEASPFKDGIV